MLPAESPRVATPDEDRYLALLPKENRQRHSIRPVSSAKLSQLPVRQFQGRPCTDSLGHGSLYALGLPSDVFHLPQLTAAISLEVRRRTLWTAT
ncbi:hypothetical protein AVEN_93042-1 [Araneus ventricosus]|uniref:Uncharacterized protein n=1 Tax=Araneus ventricosus TaxID=182803 RepID=A0A4Y2V7Q6_ARAVE|nr:hypothetical protein AVEN_93042-1 [Araneus ventricosus]